MISKSKQQIFLYSIIISTILILLANLYFRQSLYSLGIDLIKVMQTDHSSFGKWVFQFITMVSEPSVVMIAILAILLADTKRKFAFNVTMFLLLNIYLITLMKQLYVDPRPFWTENSIHSLAYYCPGQFGNPSGHSWFTTVFLFLILLKYFPRHLKLYGLIGVAVIITFVATSRMYLGAHSLNQVILGVLLGLVMNCLYYICGLDDLITQFLQNFNIKPKLGWKKYMLLFHGLYLIAYFYAQSKLIQNHNDYSNYTKNAKQQCGKAHSSHQINFQMLLASALVVNFCTGFALGYESMSLSERGRRYLSGSWQINEQRYSQTFGKFLYYIIQVLCLISGLLLAVLLIYLLQLNKWLLFLILSSGSMLSGYIYTRKCCQLLYKCSIICEVL